MNSIRQQAFWHVAGTIINLGFPLLIFPYVTRIFGPTVLGSINYIDALIQFFIIVSALGIPYYGIKKISQCGDDIEEQGRVLYQLCFVQLIVSFIAGIIFLTYTLGFTSDEIPIALIIYSLILLITQHL